MSPESASLKRILVVSVNTPCAVYSSEELDSSGEMLACDHAAAEYWGTYPDSFHSLAMSPDGFAMVGTARIRLLRNGLRIMAQRALGDDDAAEDVVQEALLRALRAVTSEIAADPDRLGAFVGGIARHVIADVKRSAARYTTQDGTLYALATTPDALSLLLDREEQARVRAAIEALGPSDQIIIRTSFYEGLTPTEIAERLNQPPERIRKRKSRALARLRAVFDASESHESARRASMKAETDTAMLAEGGA